MNKEIKEPLKELEEYHYLQVMGAIDMILENGSNTLTNDNLTISLEQCHQRHENARQNKVTPFMSEDFESSIIKLAFKLAKLRTSTLLEVIVIYLKKYSTIGKGTK